MNIKQKITVIAGVVLLVASGLFPVWTVTDSSGELEIINTRGFLYLSELEILKGIINPESKGHIPKIQVDYKRMGVEWGIIVFLTIGTVVTLKDTNEKK